MSEFVREEDAVFFTALEDPKPALLRPEETMLVRDDTPGFAMSRLYLEATLRRTPLPQSERGLAATPDSFLLDKLTYQQRPAELALKNLRPRILLADVVGLGKTLEIGLILAELIRRGRGDRILVVTPQQVLEQFQLELWTRFAIPLIRLDSLGIERIQREIPAGRNPFTYYKRIIISIDTLKNAGKYGQHLDAMRWDAVVIDESHNLIGSGERNHRKRLATRLAKQDRRAAAGQRHPAQRRRGVVRRADPDARPGRDRRPEAVRRQGHRPPLPPPHQDQPRGDQRDRRQVARARPVGSDPLPRLRGRGGRLRGADKHLARRPQCCSGRGRRPPPVPLHAAEDVPVQPQGPRRDRAQARQEQRRRHRADRAQPPRRARRPGQGRRLGQAQGPGRQLIGIGVGPRSPARAVVFSESVPTLEWLRTVLPAKLGLTKEGQVELMYGGLSDTRQQEIIEQFALADSPVRVLLTGDVASEGVNMHRQCHHLIHYDLPWSLIRIEQRNGRIDRYGQVHQPQFAALILTSQTEGAKDDTTVAEKLLAREATAHSQLGTAEGVTRQFTSRRKRTAWSRTSWPARPWTSPSTRRRRGPGADFLADLLAASATSRTTPRRSTPTVPRLFDVDRGVRSRRPRRRRAGAARRRRRRDARLPAAGRPGAAARPRCPRPTCRSTRSPSGCG